MSSRSGWTVGAAWAARKFSSASHSQAAARVSGGRSAVSPPPASIPAPIPARNKVSTSPMARSAAGLSGSMS